MFLHCRWGELTAILTHGNPMSYPSHVTDTKTHWHKNILTTNSTTSTISSFNKHRFPSLQTNVMSQCVFEHRARKPWSSLTWSEAQTQTDAHVFSDLSKSMLVFKSSVWKANVVLSANTQRVLLLLVLSVCKSCFFGFHYWILIHKRTSYDCHDLLEKRPEANEPVGCTLCIFEKNLLPCDFRI